MLPEFTPPREVLQLIDLPDGAKLVQMSHVGAGGGVGDWWYIFRWDCDRWFPVLPERAGGWHGHETAVDALAAYAAMLSRRQA